MKTMLYASIALMLIAGGAGAFDFTKMYRSGEINRIYNEDGSSPVAHVSPPVTKPVNPPQAALNNGTPITLVEHPVTASLQKTKVVTTQQATAKNSTIEEAEVPAIDVNAEKYITDGELSANTHIDESTDEAPVEIKETPKKKRLKLSMYSRAYIPEEEEVTLLTDSALWNN